MKQTKQSLTGLARNLRTMADYLSSRLGDGMGIDVDDFAMEYQPGMMVHGVETLVDNLKVLRYDPSRHAEFFDLHVFEDGAE